MKLLSEIEDDATRLRVLWYVDDWNKNRMRSAPKEPN